jgi:putative endonuclease
MMPRLASSRKKAERRGRFGEAMAALYLRTQFFSIIEKRLKTPVGEIDLVARRGALTLFVEVKIRADQDGAATALASVNRQRISRAAQYYLARHPALMDGDLRFDVIFLAPWRWPRHLKGAFDNLER